MASLWKSRFVVNTTTGGTQDEIKLEALKNGTFAAVWRDTSETGADSDWGAIRGQVFNADGSRKGAEFVANSTIKNDQTAPDIAVLNDGRFVVAWEDNSDFRISSKEIRARLFGADGAPVGADFHVNTATSGQQSDPTVSALANGGFAIAYTTLPSVLGNYSIHSQAFDAARNPIGGEVLINGANDRYTEHPNLIGWGDGYAVFFNDGSHRADDPSEITVRGGVFSAGGQVVLPEFLVPQPDDEEAVKQNPVAASLTDHRVVVTWQSDWGDGSFSCIKAQIFMADGTKAGAEFVVNGVTQDYEENSSVIALADGGFAVAYDRLVAVTDPGRSEIYLAIFDAAGHRKGADLLINSLDRVDEAPSPDLTILPDGRIVVAWNDVMNLPNDKYGIYAQIVDPRQAAVTFNGTAGDDQYVGTSFDDTLRGGLGNDRLSGGLGKDLLRGDKGKDAFLFDTAPNKKTNVDKVLDFNVKDDTIELDHAVFARAGKAGVLKKDAFFVGLKAHDASDRIVYDKKTGAVFYDDDGSGKHAALQIAQLSKTLKLTEKDFFLV